jgi:DNA polymerase elongation subunit (family B)
MYARCSAGKVLLTITGFEPYFYCDPFDDIQGVINKYPTKISRIGEGFISHEGKPKFKVITKRPTDVSDLRSYFKASCEDDIRFIRRFLIDTGIRGCFEGPEPTPLPIPYQELKPVPRLIMPPAKLYIDIETYVRGRFPNPESALEKVTCFSTFDSVTNCFISVVLSNKNDFVRRSPDWLVYYVSSERALFDKLIEIFSRTKPDIITGWNIDFDQTYLDVRGKKIGKRVSWEGSEVFGLDEMYDKIYKHNGNRLVDVIEAENYDPKTTVKITEDPIESHDYADLYDHHLEDLILKNKTHTQQLVEIDRKNNLIPFFWNLRNVVGMEEVNTTIYESLIIDALMLRKANGRVVAPPSSAHIKESYAGGLVMDPPEGILEDVAVFDMSRFYPSIMIAYNITPEKVPDLSLVPEVCKELIEERLKLDNLLKTCPESEYENIRQQRDTVKFLLNAVYGVFAAINFRWYDINIPKTATQKAREAITFANQYANEASKTLKTITIKPPVYMDTDSLLLQCRYEDGHAVEEILNKALEIFCKNEGIPPIIKLKFEKYYKSIAFRSKKHYMAWMIDKDGKKVNEIVIKGMESQRRDSSLLTRELQKYVADAVLRRGCTGVIDYIRLLRKEMLSGKLSLDHVAIRKTIHKKFEDYKANVDFLRGSRWNNENIKEGIVPGDYVKLLHMKDTIPGMKPTNVICYLDSKSLPPNISKYVDWNKMFDKTVKDKVDELLEFRNINWDDIDGKKKLDLWGKPSDQSCKSDPHDYGSGELLPVTQPFPVISTEEIKKLKSSFKSLTEWN